MERKPLCGKRMEDSTPAWGLLWVRTWDGVPSSYHRFGIYADPSLACEHLHECERWGRAVFGPEGYTDVVNLADGRKLEECRIDEIGYNVAPREGGR
jgi:hypothetical protein